MEDHSTLFRLFNPLSPTTRRTTRVLQEMQAQGGGLAPLDLEELRISQTGPGANIVTPPLGTMAPLTATPTHTNTALRPHVLDNAGPLHLPERRRLSGNNFDDSMGSVGSPDEAVIQARGRRQVPLTFSPDVTNTPLRYNNSLSLVNPRLSSTLIGQNLVSFRYSPLIGQYSCPFLIGQFSPLIGQYSPLIGQTQNY